MSPYDWLRGFLIHSTNHFDFSIQWHHAMCQRGSHLELKLTKLKLDTWHPVRHSFPRKTCKFRLSRNSTKIDVVARFGETILTSSPSSTVGAGDSSRRAVEPPLEVLPISVWSPTSQGAAPPPTMPDEVKRDLFGAVGSKDSLLSHVELAAGDVSSILRDSDLRKVDALSIEETLALLLQGIASVHPRAFIDPFLYFFSFVNGLFLVLWQVATYTKGLARRAGLTEGSTKVAKSYKAKVASLTSKRAGLRAQIRDMTKELVKHRSDLKHASTARV